MVQLEGVEIRLALEAMRVSLVLVVPEHCQPVP